TFVIKRFVSIMLAFALSACAGWATVEGKSLHTTAYELTSIKVRWADNPALPILISKDYRKGADEPIIDIAERTKAQNAVAKTTILFSRSASQSIQQFLKAGSVSDEADASLVLSPVNVTYSCWSNSPSESCIVGSVMNVELKAVLINEKSNSVLWSARMKTKLSPALRNREKSELQKMLPTPGQIVRDNIVGERSNDEVLLDQCLSKLADTLVSDGWLAAK
ncbi:MAG: hypothetical protein OEV23_05715, partial [Gallionella sp.]|nr:hypothetical protein [Gallionella sp.]